VCQTCALDLKYRVSTAVRDAALQLNTELPSEDANRQYFVQNAQTLMHGNASIVDYQKTESTARKLVRELSKIDPEKTGLKPICSYFLQGHCYRGDSCPYRHEKGIGSIATTALLGQPEQKIHKSSLREDRFRFYNTADDDYKVHENVASGLLLNALSDNEIKKQEIPEAPIDPSITSLFVSGIDDSLSEQQLKDHFNRYGSIQKIVRSEALQGAYIVYHTRSSAEKALKATYFSCRIGDVELEVRWGIMKKEEEIQHNRFNLLYPQLSIYDDDSSP
jgi:pre-mRNA-splicing factor RBM22/SLT11